MNEPQMKQLKLMRFWLFGTFIIVFAAVTTYAASIGTGLAILRELNFWMIVVITAALCVAGYFGYQGWLQRK